MGSYEDAECAEYYKGEMEPQDKDKGEGGAKGVLPVAGVDADEASSLLPPAASANTTPASGSDVLLGPRGWWSTGLFECCNTCEDTSICCVGAWMPCVLAADSYSRIHPSSPGGFPTACCSVLGLQLGSAVLASSGLPHILLTPFFTWRMRTAIRHRYNIQGWGKYFTHCMNTLVCEDSADDGAEVLGEDCQRACDFCVQYHCLPCALCQEARELRRREGAPAVGVAGPKAAPSPHSGFQRN